MHMRSLALIPFESATAPDLARGLARVATEVIQSIGRIRITPWTIAESAHEGFAEETGRRLHVDAIVVGRLEESAGRIDVDAEAIDSIREVSMAHWRYLSHPSEVGDLFDRLVRDLINGGAPLPRHPLLRRRRQEAFRAYLEGRGARCRERRRERLETATADDERFSAAWCALAVDAAERMILENGTKAAAGEAVRLAMRAVSLDPRSPEAHAVLGLAAAAEGDFTVAASSFRRATRQQAAVPLLHCGAALAAMFASDLPRARQRIAMAETLDPLSAAIAFVAASIHYAALDFPAAAASYERACAREPEAAAPWLGLARSRARGGDFDVALAIAGEIRLRHPAWGEMAEAQVRAIAGDAVAMTATESIESARLAVLAGDTTRARELSRNVMSDAWLRCDPDFRSLRTR